MNDLPIGYLLRGSTSGFVAGCRVSQFESDPPVLGGLVRTSLGDQHHTYGLIYDIHIDDDGLVRQLVTAQNIDAETIADNRANRTVPVEISVLSVGHNQSGTISHLLPPRPPLSLDTLHLCNPSEVVQFTSSGRFGYLRHVLRAKDLPVGELLASHLGMAHQAHLSEGEPQWVLRATQELIILLRDDYPTLMEVLSALGDALPAAWVSQ